jgi:hypothetical protein
VVQELRLAGITDIRTGNRFLPAYLQRFNARFTVRAEEPGLAYRPLDAGLLLDRILSFRHPTRSGYGRQWSDDCRQRPSPRTSPSPPIGN